MLASPVPQEVGLQYSVILIKYSSTRKTRILEDEEDLRVFIYNIRIDSRYFYKENGLQYSYKHIG